jgi:hypothetical protein
MRMWRVIYGIVLGRGAVETVYGIEACLRVQFSVLRYGACWGSVIDARSWGSGLWENTWAWFFGWFSSSGSLYSARIAWYERLLRHQKRYHCLEGKTWAWAAQTLLWAWNIHIS